MTESMIVFFRRCTTCINLTDPLEGADLSKAVCCTEYSETSSKAEREQKTLKPLPYKQIQKSFFCTSLHQYTGLAPKTCGKTMILSSNVIARN